MFKKNQSNTFLRNICKHTPEYRSKLHTIFLIGVCRSRHLNKLPAINVIYVAHM